MSIMNRSDFYKTGHAAMFPEGSQRVYDNWTPRSVGYAQTNKITVYGIQSLILKRLIREFNETFFALSTEDAVRAYKRRMDNAMGPGVIDTKYVKQLHELGFLPIHIKALPEGVEVNPKIPMLTIINTLDDFYWLPNYLETVCSGELWLPMTSASIAREYRRILVEYAEKTGTPLDFVNVQGHDFSCRGMYPEAAAASGSGHLLSFWGTDTISAIDFLESWYFANSDEEMVGCSVPATEHSVMCMGGQETEIDTFKRLLKLHPSGIISIVSDTWDFWKVMTEMAPALKAEIRERTAITDPDGLVIVPGKTVFRPDSGCPVKILTGYTEEELIREKGKVYELESVYIKRCNKGVPYGKELTKGKELMECEIKGAVETLWDSFGGSINDKGFKQLEEVGLIYGDSITLDRAKLICQRLMDKGFATGNVVLGIGSFTYQYNTRDTYGFAMKATWGQVNGEGREIMKDPKTDDGLKKSLKGLLRVELEDGEYVVYDQQTQEQEKQGELKTVFLNGKLTNPVTLAEIRARIQA
jgi:nicotinamide phosphoribosyltransferase